MTGEDVDPAVSAPRGFLSKEPFSRKDSGNEPLKIVTSKFFSDKRLYLVASDPLEVKG